MPGWLRFYEKSHTSLCHFVLFNPTIMKYNSPKPHPTFLTRNHISCTAHHLILRSPPPPLPTIPIPIHTVPCNLLARDHSEKVNTFNHTQKQTISFILVTIAFWTRRRTTTLRSLYRSYLRNITTLLKEQCWGIFQIWWTHMSGGLRWRADCQKAWSLERSFRK